MAGGFYSSVIGLFDSFCFSFFDLIYSSLLGLFDCQFVLNLAKFFILLLYASSNGFGEIKVSVQLNRLEKVIDRSTADGGDGSYRLQSLMVLHVTVMEFLLQTMVTLKSSIKFYGTVPQGLEKNTSSVYITTSSLPSAYEAYLNQFQRDFGTFLRMRSEEMDIVSASKVESFNMPFYDLSKEEVNEVIQNEGSFEINDLEIHGFDLGQSSSNHEECKAGEKEAKCIRAVSESMLAAHFGDDIIDALFNKLCIPCVLTCWLH
ncbi:unnamed protein product [Brassica rapa subsp. trilocularis]